MKKFHILSMLVAASIPLAVHADQPTSMQSRTSAPATSTALASCPDNLLRDTKLRQKMLLTARAFEHDGEHVNISYFDLGQGRQCAMQTFPVVRALAPTDRLTEGRDAAEPDRTKLLTASKDSPSKELSCTSRAEDLAIYAGKCGSNGARIGSAFFATPYLALGGGSQLQAHSEVCVVSESGFGTHAYYDVHQVRKSGSGEGLIAGFSTMRAASSTTGFQVINGSLFSTGFAFGASVEGIAGLSAGCQAGTINYDNGSIASFYWGRDLFANFLTRLDPGGPAYLNSLAAYPMGIHVSDSVSYDGTYYSLYPRFKRFNTADFNTLNQWVGTSAPTTSQRIELTNPVFGSVVNANLPLQVGVSSGNGYALELDGAPVGNLISGLGEGVHHLVAYQPSAPQYRHTVRFEARRMVVADSHEVDDTAAQWKPLFGGQRKFHNFHRPNDADWSAFGIGNGVALNIALTGGTFGNCAMSLYIHPNYPNGSRQLVSTRTGSCASLNVSHVTPAAPSSHAYFVETKLVGNYSGSNTDYNLYLTSARDPVAADAYEDDDTMASYKPLFGGQPQQHNFHREGDVDWTAFGVGPNYAVTVTATGTATGNARVRLYRQALYPNGPIELVATSESQSVLKVFDQYATTEPFTVYYVETSATWSGFYGSAAAYTISVDAH